MKGGSARRQYLHKNDTIHKTQITIIPDEELRCRLERHATAINDHRPGFSQAFQPMPFVTVTAILDGVTFDKLCVQH
ncbi:hypothetical protein [Azospirillum doebereinerae]